MKAFSRHTPWSFTPVRRVGSRIGVSREPDVIADLPARHAVTREALQNGDGAVVSRFRIQPRIARTIPYISFPVELFSGSDHIVHIVAVQVASEPVEKRAHLGVQASGKHKSRETAQ
jgi:hypothetical protein